MRPQITAGHIAAWSDTIAARGQLAALLRKLVHSTGTNLTEVDFPAFDNSCLPENRYLFESKE